MMITKLIKKIHVGITCSSIMLKTTAHRSPLNKDKFKSADPDSKRK